MPTDQSTGVYYELHGTGQPLLLGFPLMASQGDILGPEAGAMLDAFLSGLTDRFQVLLLDYPSIGRSADIPTAALSADRVCSDLLAVADAAGFQRFAYFGYSWGGAVGLQLAWRTDRLSALAIGGWTPLGGQYADMLRASLAQADDPPPEVQVVLRSPAQYRQWSTFYASIQDWPEARALAARRCPAWAFAGANGDVAAGEEWIEIASTLKARQRELESAGWRVELLPGTNHASSLDPGLILPRLRDFLEAAQ